MFVIAILITWISVAVMLLTLRVTIVPITLLFNCVYESGPHIASSSSYNNTYPPVPTKCNPAKCNITQCSTTDCNELAIMLRLVCVFVLQPMCIAMLWIVMIVCVSSVRANHMAMLSTVGVQIVLL